jgi:hypothetical protein
MRIRTICAHHWIVATPNGTRTSPGICRRCGLKRHFPNAFDDITQDDAPPGIAARPASRIIKLRS